VDIYGDPDSGKLMVKFISFRLAAMSMKPAGDRSYLPLHPQLAPGCA